MLDHGLVISRIALHGKPACCKLVASSSTAPFRDTKMITLPAEIFPHTVSNLLAATGTKRVIILNLSYLTGTESC
jgi:hypothetical protein